MLENVSMTFGSTLMTHWAGRWEAMCVKISQGSDNKPLGSAGEGLTSVEEELTADREERETWKTMWLIFYFNMNNLITWRKTIMTLPLQVWHVRTSSHRIRTWSSRVIICSCFFFSQVNFDLRHHLPSPPTHQLTLTDRKPSYSFYTANYDNNINISSESEFN